jgi:hypothetical protein
MGLCDTSVCVHSIYWLNKGNMSPIPYYTFVLGACDHVPSFPDTWVLGTLVTPMCLGTPDLVLQSTCVWGPVFYLPSLSLLMPSLPVYSTF